MNKINQSKASVRRCSLASTNEITAILYPFIKPKFINDSCILFLKDRNAIRLKRKQRFFSARMTTFKARLRPQTVQWRKNVRIFIINKIIYVWWRHHPIGADYCPIGGVGVGDGGREGLNIPPPYNNRLPPCPSFGSKRSGTNKRERPSIASALPVVSAFRGGLE